MFSFLNYLFEDNKQKLGDLDELNEFGTVGTDANKKELFYISDLSHFKLSNTKCKIKP